MNKVKTILLHLAFWSVTIGLPLILLQQNNQTIPPEIYLSSIGNAIWAIFTFYFFFGFLTPLLIHRKIKRTLTIIVCLLVVALFSFSNLFTLYIFQEYSGLDFSKYHIFNASRLFSIVINTVFLAGLASLLRIAFIWYRENRKKDELAIREHQLELELLKAQINPHFFFNTLNNIYSLVYTRSEHAPKAVLKLSEIMRYTLYESKAELVPLEKEVEQLENYIELEKLRVKDDHFIEYQVSGDLLNLEIPPMLLLSFVENAFKHGKKKVKSPGISIYLKATDQALEFRLSNYILDKTDVKSEPKGIGLENTYRRLDLLFPDRHNLQIHNDGTRYTVNLKILYHPQKQLL